MAVETGDLAMRTESPAAIPVVALPTVRYGAL